MGNAPIFPPLPPTLLFCMQGSPFVSATTHEISLASLKDTRLSLGESSLTLDLRGGAGGWRLVWRRNWRARTLSACDLGQPSVAVQQFHIHNSHLVTSTSTWVFQFSRSSEKQTQTQQVDQILHNLTGRVARQQHFNVIFVASPPLRLALLFVFVFLARIPISMSVLLFQN